MGIVNTHSPLAAGFLNEDNISQLGYVMGLHDEFDL